MYTIATAVPVSISKREAELQVNGLDVWERARAAHDWQPMAALLRQYVFHNHLSFFFFELAYHVREVGGAGGVKLSFFIW